ncbi:MAG: hypothetical protein EBV69_07915 [Oxalobacteraceae bacterium]|nr:hypothetical protein [Oxalobacteraceae bacterium]
MSTQYTYVDGIDSISMVDGVVRFELVTISQINGDKAQANKVGGMAMSVQGFVRTYDQMTQVINKLVEQGVLKKRDALEAPQEAPKDSENVANGGENPA